VTRALTVRQPWADLIMSGMKTVENRSWAAPSTLPFPFRLWIHAAATLDKGAAADLHGTGVASSLADLPYYQPPAPTPALGVLLGSVEVTGQHHADECWFAPDPWRPHCSPWAEPGVYHWELSDPRPLDRPVAAKGRLGLWRLDEQLSQAVPS